MDAGRSFDIHPAGMLALDVARIEAGLLLIEVDYNSSKKALIPEQKYSPYELGFGKMVHLEKENFIGKAALAQQQKNGVPRQLVGLEMDWVEIEERYEKFGLTPAAPARHRASTCRCIWAASRSAKRLPPRGRRCSKR